MQYREKPYVPAPGGPIITRTPRPGGRETEDRHCLSDSGGARISAAERGLVEAYAVLRAGGTIDLDTINMVVVSTRDCLAEARLARAQAQSELAQLRREQALADRERRAAAARPEPPGQVVDDVAGASLCPDPLAARTPDELMHTLRLYWIWAGKPSFRAMARQCRPTYAASTIHAALRATTPPGLAMVQAIITGCRGSEEHQQAFATAWRRLHMPHPGTGEAGAGAQIARPASA